MHRTITRPLSRTLILTALCTLAACTDAQPSPNPNANLVWSDEFGGNALDAAKWGPQFGNGFGSGSGYTAGWGNNELEFYTDRPENLRVQGGNLVITARKGAYTGDANGTPKTFDWTSARIRTAGKFSRTYGRFEIRAKFPTGKGFWPAIWLLPDDQPGAPYGTWAANGEIDITEGWGSKPDQVAHTIHYGGMWPNNVYSGETAKYPNGGRMDEWHTYALEWRPGEIRWLIDGQETAKRTAWWSSKATPPQSDADLNAWPAPFDKPFHLLLNLAVGGNFDGNPDASTPNEGQMLVDYVRVYSLPDENRDPGARPPMKYPWTPMPARPALADGNLVYNGSFDWTATNEHVTPDAPQLPAVPSSYFWTLYTSDGSVNLSNDAAQDHALRADITNPGGVNYAVQLRQDGLNIVSGHKYEVSFDAWASANRTMMLKVGGGQDRGFAAYSGEQTVTLGTTRERKTLTFNMTATSDAAARLEFNIGNAGANTVWFDNVTVRDLGDAGTTARPPTPDGNLLYNGNFSQNDAADAGIPGVPNTAFWRTWENGTSGLSTTTGGGEVELKVAHVDPTNNWHVQLNQPDVPLKAGRTYTLTFRGRADSARTVGVVIGENGGSYARYLDQTAALTPDAQAFTYTFTAPVNNPNAQLQVLGAAGQPGDAYTLGFSDFRLTEQP